MYPRRCSFKFTLILFVAFGNSTQFENDDDYNKFLNIYRNNDNNNNLNRDEVFNKNVDDIDDDDDDEEEFGGSDFGGKFGNVGNYVDVEGDDVLQHFPSGPSHKSTREFLLSGRLTKPRFVSQQGAGDAVKSANKRACDYTSKKSIVNHDRKSIVNYNRGRKTDVYGIAGRFGKRNQDSQ